MTAACRSSHICQRCQQGVPGMEVGGKRTLLIPASLTYGSAGSRQGGIPPNAARVFEVEWPGVQ